MKAEYIKIFSLLIAVFYINILEISDVSNKLKKNQADDIKNDYDYARLLIGKSYRTDDDNESIDNCEDSSENYFSYLTKGKSFKFDKYVDERDSVSNNYYIIFI